MAGEGHTNGDDEEKLEVALGVELGENPYPEYPSSAEMDLVANTLKINAVMSSDPTDQAAAWKTAYMLERLAARRRARGL